MIFISRRLEDLDQIAKSIMHKVSGKRIFLFYGQMGVGKTTLIKALSLHLGVKDIVSSPTFSIVNKYVTNNMYNIYHFDFYRIENESEAYDIGYEEYFCNNDYCFVEWPERVPGLLNHQVVKIFINVKGLDRIIKLDI